MLIIKNISAGYNHKQVLFDLSMHVNEGSIISLIGPNGSGKSTILKAISGILPIWGGEILFNNHSIIKNSPEKNIALGLSYSPQGNRIFDELTVKENLEIGGYILSRLRLKKQIDYILELFPILRKRFNSNSGILSGGEQQMLALARSLISNPRLLLLDEPLLGLAPNLINEVFEKLVEINQNFKLTILIVEQKVKEVLSISHQTYAIKLGKVIFSGNSKELANNKKKIRELFL